MNIHVARTPHFRTRFTHTCCQGQTGSLTVRPDTARCITQAVDLCYQRVFVCSGDTNVFVSLMFTLKPNGNVNKLTSFG